MKNFLSIISGLITAVFIICAAVTITLNCRALYEADIENYRLVETTGMPKEEILDNYQAMIDYNNLGGPDTLSFPTLSMSEGGRIHFEEVRTIFYTIEYAMIVCGAVTVFALIFTCRRKLYAYRLWTGIFTIALPAAVGLMAAVSWDSFFVFFHHVMFNNDYWIFDSATDPVITILPDGYFLHCVIMIIAVALAAAAAFIIWYIHARHRIKKAL
jgi:integral membrane protein (TIGR01906 family)